VDFLKELGVGIAIGMLAGTMGTHGSARGRMTILAAVIGLIVGFLIDGPLGAVIALVGSVGACIVISDLVAGAGRREGGRGGAIGFLVGLAAMIVVLLALFFNLAIILVVIALAWLGISRHRRSQRKHAGLRVLR
jgi:hypothetical protein